ncbi:MAG TPA: hypothetical protein VNU96_13690 [Burkholderiales bacterium]|jgi:uncharacterized peroxidase-related enzyme|nr:hypothetical protein [Burkholderiales bacterium]
MPHIPPCLPAIAPKESVAVYEEFYRGMHFSAPPNFIMTQGHAPNVARATWEAVRNILVGGIIPRWIKELMFVAISVDRQCMYCAAAHVACCGMLDVNPEWTQATAQSNVDAISDPKLRDMIKFALKCSRSPQGLSPEDFSGLRAYGLQVAQIMEIIDMAAFAVYANIIADATAMASDDMFEKL